MSESSPVDGAALLDDLRAALSKYVVFPTSEAADAVTLWIAATHAQPAWEHAPRLAVISPEKRCGKSRLLDVVEATSREALMTVNISPAALVRSITNDPPTLALDEADTVFGPKAKDNHEDLRGILNAGHQRGRPYIRWDATARAPENCPTFAMAVLAGIGDLPDTIMDRSVIVRMRRRAPRETVAPYRTRRDAPQLHVLRDRVTEWMRDHLDDLTDAEPDMPVDDRAADTWEPLIAVADLAGGHWPVTAREACKSLTGQAQVNDTTLGERLLADLRTIFGQADALHSETVLDALHKVEEAPWADWYGKPLGPRDLAKLLKPYGVTSTKVKISGKSLQGYRRADLHDPWTRYLAPVAGEPEPPEPPEPCRSEGQAGFRFRMDERNRNPDQARDLRGSTGSTSSGTHPAEVGKCTACGQPMTLVEVGQTRHPGCIDAA